MKLPKYEKEPLTKVPPSLSTDKIVTTSAPLKTYLPPTDGIEQEKRDDEAAGDVLLMTAEGSDDRTKWQI